MAQFSDPNAVTEAGKRLQKILGADLGDRLLDAVEDNPAPDVALTNLERWLTATGNPRLYLEQFLAHPRSAHGIAYLLGASQPLSDTLIQNPELATVLLDRSELERTLKREDYVAEGRRLLASTISPSHALDRLRYLKQRHVLPIVIHDLEGSWAQERVWTALSDLADAIIELTLESTWRSFSIGKELPQSPPIAIVAFGKLGARELNYSSDVDLVYVAEDFLDERVDRDCNRFCEVFGRALSDKMGRGSLYRVDLRLRPYGSAGPIVRSIRSYEGYYRLYAEAWEVQALIKSRVVAGADLGQRWERMVEETVYGHQVSDSALSEMLDTRRRIEELAKGDDLKRGPGGIRDVEFLCQMLQLVYGGKNPLVRQRSTCDALRALAEEHFLEPTASNALIDGYTFLRRLEHRTQLIGDQQTHSVPTDPETRQRLSKLMGFESWPGLERALEVQRRTIQSLYRSILRQVPERRGEREELESKLGDLVHALWQWFDVFPEPEAFYRSLLENEGSLGRVKSILLGAPRLIAAFKSSLQTTELLLSGEIEEVSSPADRVKALPFDAAPRRIAEAAQTAELIACTNWTLGEGNDLQEALRSIREAVVVHLMHRLCPEIDAVGLGSFGAGETCPGSDVDLLLLTHHNQQAVERGAQDFLALMAQLRRYGLGFGLDLRLRPDGGKGLLVRTYEGFGAYELTAMEMWERFALGHAKYLFGDPEAIQVALHAAYSTPLTPIRLKELVRMKRRIETERVLPQHLKRDVKLGYGGLNDVEWIVHLTEMRYPTATKAGLTSEMGERIRSLGRASLLNAVEVESLLDARRHLLDLRSRIFLLDLSPNLLPENPDKLDRLAGISGLPNGNEFLRQHLAIVEWVRALYLQTLERLRA